MARFRPYTPIDPAIMSRAITAVMHPGAEHGGLGFLSGSPVMFRDRPDDDNPVAVVLMVCGRYITGDNPDHGECDMTSVSGLAVLHPSAARVLAEELVASAARAEAHAATSRAPLAEG